MIIDHISNSHLYSIMGKKLAAGLKYPRETDFSTLKPARYDSDKEDIYALFQNYKNKPLNEGKWEAHRRYIDIHYLVEGHERMGYANIVNMKETNEYSNDNDCILLEGEV
jgi:biofilm protein TabA